MRGIVCRLDSDRLVVLVDAQKTLVVLRLASGALEVRKDEQRAADVAAEIPDHAPHVPLRLRQFGLGVSLQRAIVVKVAGASVFALPELEMRRATARRIPSTWAYSDSGFLR